MTAAAAVEVVAAVVEVAVPTVGLQPGQDLPTSRK